MTTRHPSIPQEMIEERNSKGRLFAQFFQSEYQFRGREVPREEENFLSRNPFFRDSLTILETENGDRGQFLAAEFSDREREILYPPLLSHLSHSFNDDPATSFVAWSSRRRIAGTKIQRELSARLIGY